MNYILDDLSDDSLTRANVDNIVYFSPIPYDLPGSETHVGDDICWCISDIPFVPCNITIKARLSADEADDTIAALVRKADEQGVSMRWYLDPDSKPADLGERLVKHGFTTWENPSPFMAVDLHNMKEDEQPPDGMEIRKVTSFDELKAWSHVATVGFGGTPENEGRNFRWFSRIWENKLPMYFYLAYMNGEPAATSQLVPAAGVGGIFYVATLPEFRENGLGYAVTLKALQEAREMGYRAGTLQASSMGEPVYKRMGFWVSGRVWTYTWTKPED